MDRLLRMIVFGFALAVSPMAYAQKALIQKGITYSGSGQKLDLCRPSGTVRKTAIIFIHGGGFSQGNRQQMAGYCKLLAQGGFTSATVSYRLTSAGHAFPNAVQDIASAVAWMRQGAGTLGIDPSRIVLVGYSAGGTLALTVGLAKGSGIAGIVSAAGISDFASLLKATPHRKLREDIDAYLAGAPAQAASPLAHVSRNDPPVFLFHGKKDALVPVAQSVVLAEKLKANQINVLFRVFEDAGHEIMLPNKHLKQLLQEMTGFLLAIDDQAS